MSKKSLLLIILSLMLIIPACIKDELTLPAKLFFDFELIPFQEGNDLKSGPPFEPPRGDMVINQGNLTIESIEFDGRRDEGKDVFFVSNLPSPVSVNLKTGHADSELSFDIPQGIYNRIELNIKLGGTDNIPLLLEGKIRKGFVDDILPMRFEYNFREPLKIRAQSGDNANKIILRKDTPATAKIVVDTRALFQFIDFPTLNEVTISIFNNKEVVVISPESNIGIFNSMMMQSRGLEKAFKVIIE